MNGTTVTTYEHHKATLRPLLEAYFRECKFRGITDQQAHAKLKEIVDAALVERLAKRRAGLPLVKW